MTQSIDLNNSTNPSCQPWAATLSAFFPAFFSGSAAALLLLGLSCFSVKADETRWLGDNWSINGFGTIGYINTKKYHDRIPRRNIIQNGERLRQNGFLMDSRLGLQVKGNLSDRWEFVSQFVFRHQLAKNIEDHIDIGFIRYHINNQWQVAVGRQAFDLFILSDHRNTGYSYDWVRPPTEFYGIMPYDSFDGIKLSHDWGDFDNAWYWKISAGQAKSKFDQDVLSGRKNVDSTEVDPIFGSELSYHTGAWKFNINVAWLKIEQDLGDDEDLEQDFGDYLAMVPGLDEALDDFDNDAVLRYASLGILWAHDSWKVQSEVSIIDSNFLGFNGERAYFHVSHRWNHWQPFVTFGYAHDSEEVDFRPPPMVGPEQSDAIERFFKGAAAIAKGLRHNQSSVTVGVRWDFATQKALKMQCDRFYFKKESGSIYGRPDFNYARDETKTWCSVAFDWVF